MSKSSPKYLLNPPLPPSVVHAIAAETVRVMVDEQGIFLGEWQPKNIYGVNLGKIFNVFAAPQDLTGDAGRKEIFRYVDAVKCIATLKSWHGFDGTDYATDQDIYKSLHDGSYKGGWIIPPHELLMGNNHLGGDKIQPDNLYTHKNTGSFKGTFTTTSAAANDSDWYWSSTQYRNYPDLVHFGCFSAGYEHFESKDNRRHSCRPVRLVEVIAPNI